MSTYLSSMNKYADYCAEGATAKEMKIRVSGSVQLHVISFTPAKLNLNPPVLFVSGWVSLMEAWKDVLKEMTRDFQVYYIETREKNSAVIRGRVRFGVADLGQDIASLVEQLEVADNQYILFGSSLGATVIMDCCQHLGKSPLCLSLVAPNAEFRTPLIWKIIILLFYPPLYFLLLPVLLWYLKWFRMNVEADREQYEKYCRSLRAANPARLKRAAMQFWRYQIWSVLDSIHMPVLFFSATHDKLHEPEHLRRMAEQISDATLIDLETNQKTHSAEVVRLIRDFIRNLSNHPAADSESESN